SHKTRHPDLVPQRVLESYPCTPVSHITRRGEFIRLAPRLPAPPELLQTPWLEAPALVATTTWLKTLRQANAFGDPHPPRPNPARHPATQPLSRHSPRRGSWF